MRNGSRTSRPVRRAAGASPIDALEPRRHFHGGLSDDGGLVGTYFDNPDFTAPALTRTDASIAFYWADAPADAVNADAFSVRWTGQLLPHSTEPHTFTIRSDGGVKLTVNGQVVIDALGGATGSFTEHSGTIPLTENTPASIQLDYVEQSGHAGVRLFWQTPTLAKEIVPDHHLDPATASPPERPPAAPAGVAVAAISASQTRLTWTDAATNESGFEILRSANLGPASVVGTTPADAAEFVDTGLVPGVRYFYRVRAVSPIGDSDWANYVNTVADGVGEPLQPPAAPGGLATAVNGDAITLGWSDNSGNETQFVVARRASGAGAAFEDIATLGADTTTFTDADVSPGIAYAYRVRARGVLGDSAASNIADATIPVVDPPPTGVDDFTEIDWSTGRSAPSARSESHVATIDGKLYVFGGFDTNTQPMSRVDVYDPAADTWSRLADMPTRLTHAGTATIGRSVYFAGGYVGIESTGGRQQFGVRDVWRYDVETDAYTKMPDLPNRRGSGALVAVGNTLHFFGGNNADRQDVPEHYVLNLDTNATTWTDAAPMLNGRSHMGYAALGGKVYAVAGQHENDDELTTQNDVDVYDPATDTWTAVTSIPQAVSHISSSTFVVGDRIIVLGGETAHQAAVRTVWAYNPADDAWTELSRLPTARRSGVAGIIDGVLYYTTGSKTATTYVGTPVTAAE